ncbi:Hsp33 family molecular chaperone [Afifella pfennigii]|uniref:Hsp33 family molecular chaperone n=1 Tax=Afifella pfennigii TaxID=209897 RepID=UPI000689EC06|nr:Hsp33 family molecular chaperone [Afifella pfennigii]
MSVQDQSDFIAGADDRALPFQVDPLDVRGRVVTLGPALDAILARHDLPRPVKVLLGEAVALASLLATSLKDTGRFILQAETDGPVSLLVVDIRTPGQIRATATCNRERVEGVSEAGRASSADLLGSGTLAMTIEQGRSGHRYQGYVKLQHESLEAAAHAYFRQSEQIPTRVRLAVAEILDRGEAGEARQAWRAGGLIAQFLPDSPDRITVRDLPPGDAPEDAEPPHEAEEDDAWVEAAALVDTVEDVELIDPSVPAERLLLRLFHERGVRVFDATPLEDRCTCSRQRIAAVLEQLPAEELTEAAESGAIAVRCEFCGKEYRFDPDGLGKNDV